jgi:hypothetical protein
MERDARFQSPPPVSQKVTENEPLPDSPPGALMERDARFQSPPPVSQKVTENEPLPDSPPGALMERDARFQSHLLHFSGVPH